MKKREMVREGEDKEKEKEGKEIETERDRASERVTDRKE